MDDVQYLLKSAKEESYLFVVDSRSRDTAVFPTPSEYEISFASPFKNVFGLDIIDATIARTEFIVDTTSNTLEYVMNQPNALTGQAGRAWNQGEWVTAAVDGNGLATPKRTIRLDPGDYNLPQFIDHLNAKLQESATLNGEPAIKCAAQTNPAEISNRIVFTCSRAFTFLMASSTLRWTLGFGDPVQSTTSPYYAAVPGWTVNRTGGASHAFLSVPEASLPDTDPQAATIGPLPTGQFIDYEPLYGARDIRQYFDSLTTGPPTTLLAYVYGTPGCPALHISVKRASDNALMATGAAAVQPEDPNDVYDPIDITLTPEPGVILETGVQYYVQFRAASSGGSASQFVGLYYGQDNLPVQANRYITLDGGEVHAGQNLCMDLVCSSWGHALRCPGIVNLTGPRYVTIRCPDIESHMFRDRVNEPCHPGIGMVQLRGYGFREQRFDFVSFPPRRFHPIGRLTKLRFRLERPDGSLYESHGVDHTMLLVLRFYSLPESTAARGPSPLNPAYVPDIREHMITRRWPEEAKAMDRIQKWY